MNLSFARWTCARSFDERYVRSLLVSIGRSIGMAQATSGTHRADRSRPAACDMLNGEWASIVDPYFAGLFSFHHEEKKNGWFLNS